MILAAYPGKAGNKGRALLAGLSCARDLGPPAILLADADLGASAAMLERLLAALDQRHPATIAAFPPASDGGFGLVKRYARRAIFGRT